MSASFTFDATAFRAGLRHKLSLTKRSEAEVLNGAAKDVCLTAIRLTPAAKKSVIESELRTNGLLFKILQSPNSRARLPRKVQAMLGGGGRLTRAQINQAARLLLAMRKNSVNATRAGWIKAAQAFGGSSRAKVSGKGNPGKGYGTKATSSTLAALGVNMANGAAAVGRPALQKALDTVGRRMSTYAPKKIAKVWN